MRIIAIAFLLVSSLVAFGKSDEEQLLKHLDQALSEAPHFTYQKERHIKQLKRNLADASTNEQRLVWMDSIYLAYSTYRYDSATAYVNKGLQLAQQIGNKEYIVRNEINRAQVLSVGGFYSQSEAVLKSMNPEDFDRHTRKFYYSTYAWLYNYWSAFCANSEFADGYMELKKKYILLTLENFKAEDRNTALYHYLAAECEYLDHPTSKKVLDGFMKAVRSSATNTRVHASAAYGVARYFLDMDRTDLYEQYLVEAAISDSECQLKETVALQKLATFLYKKDPKYNKRAARYIKISMEDAQFFNNRLRMMEISSILPVIASANQAAAERSRTRFQVALIVSCVCLLIAVITAVVSNNRKNKLKRNRRVIEQKNKQLEELNGRLIATNKRRETYLRLFMDISALYIRKLDDYRKLVSRKIKARQTDDLLKTINSYKLAENDSMIFYHRFDKAFLELYPHFVDEFNELLLPEYQITLPQPGTLTTEVRIYALMRLGVTDSQEIATLLFYSTQTIYNYKSSMRSKAKNRETFENDINRLCHII